MLRFDDHHPPPTDGEVLLDARYPSSDDGLQAAVHAITASLDGRDAVTDRFLGKARLAVAEVLLNAIHHGNRGDPTRGVRCRVSLTPTRIRVAVTDEGAGFSPEDLPDYRDPLQLYEAEHGRGLMLAAGIFEAVTVYAPGNTVVLSHPRAAA